MQSELLGISLWRLNKETNMSEHLLGTTSYAMYSPLTTSFSFSQNLWDRLDGERTPGTARLPTGTLGSESVIPEVKVIMTQEMDF